MADKKSKDANLKEGMPYRLEYFGENGLAPKAGFD